MDEPKTIGVQQAREQLRARIDAALERGEHTVITRAGRSVAVLVPYGWYARRKLVNEMVDVIDEHQPRLR